MRVFSKGTKSRKISHTLFGMYFWNLFFRNKRELDFKYGLNFIVSVGFYFYSIFQYST